MCPKLIGWPHFESAQMLEFVDGFQLVFVLLHIIHLPQGFRSTNLIVPGWLTRIRPTLHAVRMALVAIIVGIIVVGAIVVGAIVVGVFFDVGTGSIGSSGINKQSNRQITEENSSGTILKHVKSVESVLCDKHKFSSYVSN